MTSLNNNRVPKKFCPQCKSFKNQTNFKIPKKCLDRTEEHHKVCLPCYNLNKKCLVCNLMSPSRPEKMAVKGVRLLASGVIPVSLAIFCFIYAFTISTNQDEKFLLVALGLCSIILIYPIFYYLCSCI